MAAAQMSLARELELALVLAGMWHPVRVEGKLLKLLVSGSSRKAAVSVLAWGEEKKSCSSATKSKMSWDGRSLQLGGWGMAWLRSRACCVLASTLASVSEGKRLSKGQASSARPSSGLASLEKSARLSSGRVDGLDGKKKSFRLL